MDVASVMKHATVEIVIAMAAVTVVTAEIVVVTAVTVVMDVSCHKKLNF
jgi:hypothetical protein